MSQARNEGWFSSFVLSRLTPYDSLLTFPDYFIRSRQHIRRNRQADLLGCLEIDDELKLFRLFDRKVCGLSAFQNFIYKSSSTPMQITNACPVSHEPTSLYEF